MPRPDRSHERIPAILGAAARVFARDGLDGAKLDDVAKEAGLSKAAIYLYFKNKQALVSALLEAFFAANLDALKAMPEGADTAARLNAWLDQVGAAMVDGAHFQTIGFEFMALAGRDQQAREMMLSFYAQYQKVIAEMLVVDGIGETEAQARAEEIIAFLEGLNFLWMAHGGLFDFLTRAKSGVKRLLA